MATHVLVQSSTRKPIAPLWHTLVLLVLLMIPAIFGLLLQSSTAGVNQAFSNRLQVMLKFYVPVLAFEWFLVLFIWLGIRKRGESLRSLIGGNWAHWRKLVLDIGLGLAMWPLMLIVGMGLSRILGPGHAQSTSVLLPQRPAEMVLWVAISMTAGFVEEFVYRGYLQTQFVRWGLAPLAAVIAQALIFGLGHSYEGFNAVLVIAVYALMFGALAWWRRSLRPGILGHAWFDFAVVFLLRR